MELLIVCKWIGIQLLIILHDKWIFMLSEGEHIVTALSVHLTVRHTFVRSISLKVLKVI